MIDKRILGVFLFFMLVSGVYATTQTINSGGSGGSGGEQGPHNFCFPITASGSGTLSTIGIRLYSGGGNLVGLAIYDDSSGTPNNLLGTTTPVAMTSDWYDEAVSGAIAWISGTQYWICEANTGGSLDFYYVTAFQYYGYGNSWTISWDNPFSVQGSQTGPSWEMRVAYITSTTSTSTSTTSSTSSTSSTTSTSSTSSSTSTTSSTTTSSTSSTSTTSSTSSTTSIPTTSTIPTTSLSTTTIDPFKPVNTTGSKNLPYTFTYSFALPYFFSGIVILLVAIVGLMTKRSDLAVITGLVSSICFYLIIGDPLLLGLCIVFASLVVFAVLEELHKKG